jgi:hypothetical protein
LDTNDLVAIAEQVATHGEKYESLILPKTYRWTDKALRSRFESAMVKEIDDMVITPGVGDRPLWMHWGIGAHAGQFKSFAMATMRAVLIQGAQSMDAKNIQGALASTAIGAGIYTLKQIESGREVSDNPAKILLEGIDRGGLTAYLMDIDSMASRLGGYSIQGLVDGEGASRMSSKGKWDILLGPTAGTLDQVSSFMARTLPHAVTGEMVQNDIPPGFNLLPYGKVPYWRWILERARRAAQEGLPAVIQEEE